MGALRVELTPDQRAQLRASSRKELRSWRFCMALALLSLATTVVGLLVTIGLFWSASFAPNGWFAWLFALLSLTVAVVALRAGLRQALARREAVLAGREHQVTHRFTAMFCIAIALAAWSAIAATYVSNFGPNSAEVGPRMAKGAVRYLLSGGK